MTKVVALVFWMAPAHGEYRAFELVVSDPNSGQEQVVISTLTPDQYLAYAALRTGTKVTYRATWMCRGDTSHKPVCPNPKR